MTMSRIAPGALRCAALLFVGLAVVGCREENQGQVIRWEPGVYKGQADEALTEADRRELRARAAAQAGTVKGNTGGATAKSSVATTGTDVRPPANTPDQPSTYKIERTN